MKRKKAGKPKKVRQKKSLPNLNNSVYDMKGKKVGEVRLDEKIFGDGVNMPLLHQVVLMYHANKHSGTASTKIRSEVRGGGKKPWRQKGTGRARVGSIRNPIWRGGGIAFGPRPRDYSYSIPAKMKNAALKSSLSSKLIDDQLLVLDKIELKEPKTRLFKTILDSLKIKGSALVILSKIDENINKASRNIPKVTLKTFADFNALDVLRHENIVITESALKDLSKAR